MDREIALAIEVLRKGGIILYPTDTVWGIGCDATNAEAVAKVYALKRSENKHAMLVLCRDADMVVRYVDKAPGIAFEVMEMATKPLTLILPGATGLAANLIPEVLLHCRYEVYSSTGNLCHISYRDHFPVSHLRRRNSSSSIVHIGTDIPLDYMGRRRSTSVRNRLSARMRYTSGTLG